VFRDAGAAVALEAERDRQRRLAERDPLTGLANRRTLDDHLAAALGLAEVKGSPVGVIVLDLDHFKAINDGFGHAEGDRVLVEVSRILMRESRSTDLVARYGGEEFVVVLPDGPTTVAASVAERMRRALADATPPRLGRPLTGSFGVAMSRVGDTAAILLARADAALYAAKRAGRDRVEVG
jgi:diguanylate cyclase (GGDEF)-like protein